MLGPPGIHRERIDEPAGDARARSRPIYSAIRALEDPEAPRAGINRGRVLWINCQCEDGGSGTRREPIVHGDPAIGGATIGALEQSELSAGINGGWRLGIDSQ